MSQVRPKPSRSPLPGRLHRTPTQGACPLVPLAPACSGRPHVDTMGRGPKPHVSVLTCISTAPPVPCLCCRSLARAPLAAMSHTPVCLSGLPFKGAEMLRPGCRAATCQSRDRLACNVCALKRVPDSGCTRPFFLGAPCTLQGCFVQGDTVHLAALRVQHVYVRSLY